MSSGLVLGSSWPVDKGLRSVPPEAWLEGSSAAITRVRAQILRAAPYFRTAFLTGERGSGEEEAAHMLHQLSPLSHRPFITLTTADVEESIAAERSIESLAMYGMLYLPQTECIPLATQQELIRLIRRRGSEMPCIVAFAEWDLSQLRRSGRLSSEMAGAFALTIKIPSLRDRSQDIPALLSFIYRNVATQSGSPPSHLHADLLDAAMKIPWFGNLIELHSAAEALMQRAAKGSLHASDLEAVLEPALCETRTIRLEDVIQQHIRAVLFTCHGDRQRAAQLLGISRSSLYRMLKNKSDGNAQTSQT